jgi:AcrR family transcriptional regulator
VAKAGTRRDAILELLADHVLAEGLSASSLKSLAAAARTSDRMLLYYFRDKADLMTAVLDLLARRLTADLSARTAMTPLPLDALRTRLAGVLLDDAVWPYMRLWLEIASLAARGDPVFRSVGEAIGRGFLAWGAAQLDSPSAQARAVDAARLLVAIEGMAVLKAVGMADVAEQAT